MGNSFYINLKRSFLFILFLSIFLSCKNTPNNSTVSTLNNIDTSQIFKSVDDFFGHSALLTTQKIEELQTLAKVWGFLKYHHPSVKTGKYNWDNHFFLILSKILSSSDDINNILTEWINSLEKPEICVDCDPLEMDDVKLMPEYAGLFTSEKLSQSLKRKLAYFKDNSFKIDSNFYVKSAPSGNPNFTNELDYGEELPNISIRLLALFRYWNIIQYYYPYRYLAKNWDEILIEYIPQFIAADNKTKYTLTFLKLISRINDSHAGIYEPKMIDHLYGNRFLPVSLELLADTLVVTNIDDKYRNKIDRLQKGDVILEIDNRKVDNIVKSNLELTPASNIERKLFLMTSPRVGSLIRTTKSIVDLKIQSNKRIFNVKIKTVSFDTNYKKIDFCSLQPKYKLLPDNIGYLNASKLKDNDIIDVRKKLIKTKGLIIDLRQYPGTFMPYVYGSWLKSSKTPFVRFSYYSKSQPGKFLFLPPLMNGGPKQQNNLFASSSDPFYKGKIILLVNSGTISQGEFTAMAFGSIPGALTLGSKTAGADGDVSLIPLPGGASSYISGLGVYYPDGSETQQVGIKVDVQIAPTVDGIRKRRDEILEKAIEIINNNSLNISK